MQSACSQVVSVLNSEEEGEEGGGSEGGDVAPAGYELSYIFQTDFLQISS